MQTLLFIATLVSSVFGIHAPAVVPVQETLTPEMSRQIDAYVSKIQKPQILGAAPSPAALATYTLSGAGVYSSATSITLTSLAIKQTGQKIQTSDLRQGASDLFYVTLEPGNTTRQEIVGCSTVTQNSNGTATLGTCSRGMSPIYPYTASSTLRFTHAGSSQVIFGDAPQIFNDFNNYIASAVVSGAVDSSATVKGIVEKATGAEAASHAAVGSGNTTAPIALTTDIASSTRTGANQNVIVASSTGYLDETFLVPIYKNPYTFSATTTLATTTINNYIPQGTISTTTLINGTTMTLTNVPANDFTKIMISASSTSNGGFVITFNGDSGSNYQFAGMNPSQAATPTYSTSLSPLSLMTGSPGQAFVTMDILNQNAPIKYINLQAVGVLNSTSAPIPFATSTGAFYKGSGRITSVTVTSSGTLVAGSWIKAITQTSP